MSMTMHQARPVVGTLAEETLLRLPDVMQITKLGRSTIYRRVAAKQFPAPVKAGSVTRWRSSDIQSWIASLKG